MAIWKCSQCGATKESKCKPRKCSSCGASDTMTKAKEGGQTTCQSKGRKCKKS